jgi:hypothetical protein
VKFLLTAIEQRAEGFWGKMKFMAVLMDLRNGSNEFKGKNKFFNFLRANFVQFLIKISIIAKKFRTSTKNNLIIPFEN